MNRTAHVRLALVATATLMAAPGARADFWRVGTVDDLDCRAPLEPASADLFAWQVVLENTPMRALLHSALIDGSQALGPEGPSMPPDWSPRTGAWHVSGYANALTIGLAPTGPESGLHPGHVLVRILDQPVALLDLGRPVPIEAPVVRGLASGNEVRWPWWPIPAVPCDVAGDPRLRALIAWNVYRLDAVLVPREMSTAVHYLCGTDANCSTPGDGGFVTQVPATSASPDGFIRFVDPDGTERHSYVVQPVLFADAPRGILADLDADGAPEFIDPTGRNYGLTTRAHLANGSFVKNILISPDSVRDGTGGGWSPPLPRPGRLPPLGSDLRQSRRR